MRKRQWIVRGIEGEVALAPGLSPVQHGRSAKTGQKHSRRPA